VPDGPGAATRRNDVKTAAIAPAKIRIRAPDAEAAFALEARLARDGVPAGVRDVWTVELESATNGLEEIEAEVRRWLQELQLPATVVSVCGRDRTIEIELEAGETLEPEPLGSGYDERVLEHEP
jgi:hypothetical protein